MKPEQEKPPECIQCHKPAVKGLRKAWMCPKCGYAFGGER